MSASVQGQSSARRKLALGAVAGVMLSPVAAALGAAVGARLGDRPIGWALAVKLIGVAAGLAACLFVVVNGGLIDESGSARPLGFMAVLGALAGVVAVAMFVAARRMWPVGSAAPHQGGSN